MIVRKCTAADKEIWVKLNQEHMDEALGGGNLFWEETKERGIQKLGESFDIALEKDPSIILLLFEKDGEVVGNVNLNAIYSVWSKGESLIVDDFFIKEEFRGKGLGQEGIVLIEQYAMENGYRRIQFLSVSENEGIQKVWEDYGYNPMDMKFYMRYI
ncbi:MAG: GNAT family N-acetyltransferase [Eubacterium sp.]|jgi:GNAT superfamily N-acetyltransferase|nr:GNAT family N-acetyltransferase [Eubacterium sp.]